MYYKADKFKVSNCLKFQDIQVKCLSSPNLDVMGIYRSSDCRTDMQCLSSLIDPNKQAVICGDFNICYHESRNHPLVQLLLQMGFEHMVRQATHINGGWIDHVYVRKGDYHQDMMDYW